MNLAGRSVRFRLRPGGRQALSSVVGEIDELQAFVVSENHLGAWVSVPELESPTEVVLLRWEHFSTAFLEYEPEVPLSREAVGFTG
jgi:hypothetical protein